MDHTNSFFATILENSSPTLVTDISGRILYVNRPALYLLEKCRPFKRPSSNINDSDPSSFINSHYTSIIEPLDAYEATSLRNHFMNNVQILSKRSHVCRTIKCRTFSSKRPVMLEFSTRTCSTEGTKNLILISTIRDVTDSKFQEFVLNEADHRMSITYDVLGVISEVSRSCESILGYKPDELLGNDGYNFIHPDDATKIRTLHAKRAVENYGTTLQRQAFRHLKKDGSYCLLEIWSQGLQPDGSWSFIGFDITDASEHLMDNRNMISDQTFIRKLLPKNVEGESRDKAANNFVSFICHELRNPLNGIIGFTSLILDTALSEQQRDFAEAISSISSYMCNIINQSLDLCQTQSHGTASTDIGPLRLRDIVEFGFLTVTVLARNKGTELRLQDNLMQKFQSNNGTINMSLKNIENKWYGDEDIIRKILLNYLTNAIKHTGSGTVTVRLEVESDKLKDGKEGFMARCSVEDTGPGIPKKDLKRLFLPYSKLVSSFGEMKNLDNDGTKSPNHQQSHRSSGLGLSICKELADKIGGKVGVESVLGKGSTFWFTFPVYTSMPEDVDDDPDTGASLGKEMRGRSEDLDKEKSLNEILWTKSYSNYSRENVFENGREDSIVDGISSINSSTSTSSGTSSYSRSNSVKSNASSKSRRKHKKPAKVLMVEDNETNQRVALKYLEKMGEKVTIAANGIEALEKMKNENFDILFVDLQMPLMDGYDLTRRIREAEREAEREVCQYGSQDCELTSYSTSGSSTPPPTPPGSSSALSNGHQSVIPFSSLIKSPSYLSSLQISTKSPPIISSTSSVSSSSSNYSSSSSSSSSESSSSSYPHSQLPSPTTSSSSSGLPKNNINLRDSHQPVPSSPPISPPSSHKRHKHVPIVACTANVLDEEKGRCRQHGMDGFLSKPYKMEQMKQCIEELVESDEESSGGDEERNVGNHDYDLPIKHINHHDHGYEKNLSIAPI